MESHELTNLINYNGQIISFNIFYIKCKQAKHQLEIKYSLIVSDFLSDWKEKKTGKNVQ